MHVKQWYFKIMFFHPMTGHKLCCFFEFFSSHPSPGDARETAVRSKLPVNEEIKNNTTFYNSCSSQTMLLSWTGYHSLY